MADIVDNGVFKDTTEYLLFVRCFSDQTVVENKNASSENEGRVWCKIIRGHHEGDAPDLKQ